MERASWISTIDNFIKATDEEVLGQLFINDVFETKDQQHGAWKKEITILKKHLNPQNSFSKNLS